MLAGCLLPSVSVLPDRYQYGLQVPVNMLLAKATPQRQFYCTDQYRLKGPTAAQAAFSILAVSQTACLSLKLYVDGCKPFLYCKLGMPTQCGRCERLASSTAFLS